MEKNNRKRLSDRIKYIKRVLKTPYHLFTAIESSSRINPKLIYLLFEDKDGKRFSFTSNTIHNAISAAEDYVDSEIKAGTFKEPAKKK